jgi:hypothetical protein
VLKYETNEVPEGLESHYEDAGNGVFKLKVDGVVPAAQFTEIKTKLGEFRNTNVDLKKRVDQLAQFEEMFKSGEFSSEKLQTKVEALALERAGQMKTAYDEQVAQLTQSLEAEKSRLANFVMSDAVGKMALKHGVSDTAIEDVLARARQAFKVEDGQLIAADGNLDAKGNKVTLENWMASLAATAPHLFAPSRGTGAAKTGRPVPPQLTTDQKISKGAAQYFRK